MLYVNAWCPPTIYVLKKIKSYMFKIRLRIHMTYVLYKAKLLAEIRNEK